MPQTVFYAGVSPLLDKTVVCSLKMSAQKSKVKSKGKKVYKSAFSSRSNIETCNVTVETVQKEFETPCSCKTNRNQPSPLNLTDTANSQVISPKRLEPPTPKNLSLNSITLSGLGCTISVENVRNPDVQLTSQKLAPSENLSKEDLAPIVGQIKTKIIFSDKLDEVNKSLESFTDVSAKIRVKANSYNTTSVVSSTKSREKESASIIKEKFPLHLPYKYKLLEGAFQCVDIVVRRIHNEEGKVTFEKVKQYMVDMFKKKFVIGHLGQIITVFPSAYTLEYQKNADFYRTNSSPYQLIITPIIEGGCVETPFSLYYKIVKNKQNSFIYMTTQHLRERACIFQQNLLKITKRHYQEFLARKDFPTVLDDNTPSRPLKFHVDSVPDIPVGALPEPPKMEDFTIFTFDLYKCYEIYKRWVYIFESAGLSKAEEEEGLEMLERLPKIVNILLHENTDECSAVFLLAVDVVDKIMHSCNLSTPDAVIEHLNLIMEIMPGLLSFNRGEYSNSEYLVIRKWNELDYFNLTSRDFWNC